MPLDPTNPKQRTRFILKDSDCKKVLVCDDSEYDYGSQVTVLNIDALTSSKENPAHVNEVHDLVYLIYTSGTTGEPKGSMIENRNIVRLVKNTNYVDFTDIRILQTGSLAFDASTFEIWGALLNGGSVYLCKKESLETAEQLRDTLNKHDISALWLTSTLFNQMVMMDRSIFDRLEYLLVGGEKLSEAHVNMLREHNKKTRFINGYGPTENTTFTLTYEVGNHVPKVIPIGKPIANTTAYIMNGELLCGIGMPGELCVSGDGVSRGYLNCPELTAEKFVTNPYGEGRMYRTGDLARWLPDGNIEYLGRIDDQVKLRGFRVELGEIASRILQNPSIRDAAVIAQEKNENRYLCGYVVSDREVDVEGLKSRLGESLPEYMIPAYIIQMESLPITQNGKLDRRALPEPEVASSQKYVAPEGEKEEQVASVFCEILGVKKIGMLDDFFKLGGESIKAIRLIGLIKIEFGIEITIKELFHNSVLRDFCNLIEIKEKSLESEFFPLEIEVEED